MAINLSQMGNKRRCWKLNITFYAISPTQKYISTSFTQLFHILCFVIFIFLLPYSVLGLVFRQSNEYLYILNWKYLNYMKHLFVIKTLLWEGFFRYSLATAKWTKILQLWEYGDSEKLICLWENFGAFSSILLFSGLLYCVEYLISHISCIALTM